MQHQTTAEKSEESREQNVPLISTAENIAQQHDISHMSGAQNVPRQKTTEVGGHFVPQPTTAEKLAQQRGQNVPSAKQIAQSEPIVPTARNYFVCGIG
ncbi:hypothetical protein [Sporotomaculum syntrophicum]|uniref:hypothetical protein n=1 Tax=Sporotomaculum syntrophicum TaxID=182264 RepID=UPI0013797030|nr:hypothetical protein [Sporotomaculum syntrophicum]